MRLKKSPPWNVLVFPAASEVGLEICRALGTCKEVVLHGANQSGLSLANFHFRRLHELPAIHNTDCLPSLKQLVMRERIDAIFPAYDDVLLWLSEHSTELGCALVAPSLATTTICRSKSETYKTLRRLCPFLTNGVQIRMASIFPYL